MRPPREDHWREIATAASRFVIDHGRHPRAHAGDPAERGLGTWLQKARRASDARSTIFWSVAREEFLDENYPTWRGERDVRWRANALAAARFFSDHGYHPRARANDPKERRLGDWLRTVRTVRKGPQGADSDVGAHAERTVFLDENYPEWRGGDWLWLTRAREVADFKVSRARCPSSLSSDADEARLGRWLATNRRAADTDARTWTPARAELMDRIVPDWRASSYAAAWQVQALELAAFMTEHGRRPKKGGHCAAEGRAGRWLCRWRAACVRHDIPWTPERETFMDEHCPGWRA